MNNVTELRLPFKDTWFTFWGGDTKELNKHFGIGAQSHAFDFIVTDENGKTHSGSGERNDDYYSFGKDILSPSDGTVIEAVDGLRDNKPGVTNDYMFVGNYVLIKHTDKEFSLLAHLRQGSVLIKSGDQVKTGQKLSECGNSGNTSQPHLHYHLQNSDIFARFGKEYKREEVAKGLKAYFSNIEVQVNKNTEVKFLHSPVKGEVVRNIDK